MTKFVLSGASGFSLDKPLDWIGYFHGFRSSPQSVKAQKVAACVKEVGGPTLWMPQLLASPKKAIDQILHEVEALLAAQPKASIGFIGSSLGGFYATIAAERFVTSRVALLNPAVDPAFSLRDQLGRKKVYFSEEEIEFIPEYLNELGRIKCDGLTAPERYLLMAARDDETLNCEDMLKRYPGVNTLHIQGSDHAISDFDEWLPFLQQFMGLK